MSAVTDPTLTEVRDLVARGALADAHKLLVGHLQKHDSAEGYLLLSQIFETSGHLAQAEECYLHILRGVPEHAGALKGLAEFYDRNKASQQSRAYWQKYTGLHPGDLLAAMTYAEHILDDAPDDAIARLENVLAQVQHDDLLTLKVLERVIVAKERRARNERGLMPYHVHGLDEMFFPLTAKDVLRYRQVAERAVKNHPENGIAHISKAIGQFVGGEGASVETTLAPARAEIRGLPFVNMRNRASGFYNELAAYTDEDIFRGLPPVETVVDATFSDRPVALLASDGLYFERFCIPLLLSIAAVGAGAQVHIHLMDPTAGHIALAQRLASTLGLLVAVTTEAVPAAEKAEGKSAVNYFHAIRFIRFYEYLMRYRAPIWLMDVDALFNRDPRELFAKLGDADVAMRARPGRWEPWHQFSACAVGAAPSAASYAYFSKIAAHLAYFYERGEMTWGIDQLAMYVVFENMRESGRAPAVALLDNRVLDFDATESGVLWLDAGKAKHRTATPLASIDPPTARYRALFQRYQEAARES